MKLTKKKYINELLSENLKPYGFARRGSGFFRVQGDGVLQVIKFEYERVLEDYDLSVGLFSMYGELQEQWFTSGGCIPRYSTVNFIGLRDPIITIYMPDDISYDKIVTPEEQIRILMDKGIPWLNGIQTQKQLVEGICWLDKQAGKGIWWNDDLKFDPFLAAGQKKKAMQVITAILKQHIGFDILGEHPAADIHWPDQEWEDDLLDAYEKCYPGKDEEFLKLYRMIKRNNPVEIDEYLMKNYEQNRKYASFCFR